MNRQLYHFPMAAITKHHHLRDSKQHIDSLLVLEVRSLKSGSVGWSQNVSRVSFFWRLWVGNPFPYCFHLLETAGFPLAPESITPVSAFAAFSLDSDPPDSSYKDPCNYTGPIWMMQDNLPIFRTLVYSYQQCSFCHKRWHGCWN